MNLRRRLLHSIVPFAVFAGAYLPHGIVNCLAEIPGYPAHVEAFDPREIAMLPHWCIYTQMFRERVPGGNNPEEIKRGYATMGDVFHHMHHYCLGLMKSNRAMILSRNQIDRQFYLGDSINEFDYAILRSTDDFVLMPEMLTKRGENQLRLNRTALGVNDLMHAIRIKPTYWPAYEILAEHYRTNGEIAKAREILQDGISHSPNSKTLKLRLEELDSEHRKRKPAQ